MRATTARSTTATLSNQRYATTTTFPPSQQFPPQFSREPDPSVPRPVDPRPPALRLRDLECIRVLGNFPLVPAYCPSSRTITGSGQDGQVLLVRTTRDIHPLDLPGSLFALKVFKRKIIRALDGVRLHPPLPLPLTLTPTQHKPEKKNVERSLLSQLPWNSFVTGIVDAFHDWRNLYLALEFIPCGSLRSLIQKHAPLRPATSAFYFANIVTALAFLQRHEIVHRDVKPENILIGADGYLSLVDFGTAAKEDDKDGWLMVGTPTYMAPELFQPQGSAYLAVDWWSAGCVLYEMTTRKFVCVFLPFHPNRFQPIF